MSNNKIQRAIELALNGKLRLEQRPDYCLRVVRQVVEAANGWDGGTWFARTGIMQHLTQENRAWNEQNVENRAQWVPWARSMEKTFIDLGWTVPLASARAGDVVFSRVPVAQGHIGVLGVDAQGRLHVLENATVRRGRSLGGALNWVPLALWGTPTTVGRMPREWVFEPEPAQPVPAPMTPAAQKRIAVTDGSGRFIDRTGTRYVLPLADGYSLVVNDTDPDKTFVDVRQGVTNG